MDFTEPEPWVMLAGWATVIVTVLLFVAASRQIKQSEQARRDQNQPYVYVDLRPEPEHLPVVICVVENTGATVATDVEISFEPPLFCRPDSGIEQIDRLQVPSLPPGRRLRYYVDHAHQMRRDDNAPKRYLVTITGRGPYGPIERLSYPIDLDLTSQILLAQTPYTAITDPLKDIKKELTRQTAALTKIADKETMPSAREPDELRPGPRRISTSADRPSPGPDESQGPEGLLMRLWHRWRSR